MESVRVSHRPITWPLYLPWASYQIRKIAGCACAGNAGNVFPRRRLQRKPLVSDPGMHHGTCVTHVPWCMSGSFNCGDGENVPGIPGACAPAILRIWQEAHALWPKNKPMVHPTLYPTLTSSISGQSNLPFLEYGYQNLTLKTQAQVHRWGQNLKSQIGSNMLSIWPAKLWDVHAFMQL